MLVRPGWLSLDPLIVFGSEDLGCLIASFVVFIEESDTPVVISDVYYGG